MGTTPIDYRKLAKKHGAISSVPEDASDWAPDSSDVPAFIKNGIDMSRVRQVEATPQNAEDRNSIAAVGDDDPYKVKVYATDLYGPPIENHELSHTYQATRNPKLNISAPIPRGASREQIYGYGGVQGLQNAINNKKTIADFNVEQQAEIVKDYKALQDKYLQKAKQGKITPEDLKQMYIIHQAYHPFIQQFAGMPGQQENLSRSPLLELLGAQKPVPIGGPPPAPGLPAYDTPGLGVLPADPLMGGQSQPTSNEKPRSSPQNGTPVLQEVLKEYPGLAKTFNTGNTTVVFATGDRSRRGLRERGGLEYWSSTEKGTADFPSPAPGKNVLEIYSDELKKNPKALKLAIYGDLMHGMSNDPYWKGLREQFMQSFTPQELKRQAQHQTWWNDVNGSKEPLGAPTYDAYIRGWIANEGEGKKGQAESGNTMYSPKQIHILQQMQDYLRTGKAQSNPTLDQVKSKAAQLKAVGVK